MARIVGLIDFGSMGNIESIRNALEAAGANVKIIQNAKDFKGVERYVLPGVGSFPEVMQRIHSSRLYGPIRDATRRYPTLGICLGMQILATVGYEFGETDGLGLIDGEVRLMQCKSSVPHIGFGRVQQVCESPLFSGISETEEFYFMHSYEFVNYTDVAALSSHGQHKFVAAVSRGKLHGVQFHPEKSRDTGIKLLRNFVEL